MKNFLQSKFNLFFTLSIAILTLSIIVGITTDSIYFWGVPIVMAITYIVITDIKWLYYIFFLVLPFTIEYYLPNGTGIDLPGELILLFLTLITLIYISANFTSIDISIFNNKISKILYFQLTWILFTAVFANDSTISFKFFLAKMWYIIPMYFLTIIIIKRSDLRIIFRNLIIVTVIMIIYGIIRHSATAFDFSTINKAIQPFFRNHVTYASLLTIVFPFTWLMFNWYKGTISRILIIFTILIFILGIFLSYTRAAHVSIIAMVFAYYAIKYKLIKPVLVVATISAIILFTFLLKSDNYLNYSPNFEKTVTYDDFDDIVNATYNGTDLSTVERGYRWVAGYHMIKEKPILGFGPGNFYSSYRPYTVRSFETYVSDNPEKSGIHSYYIMTFVEQGIIGFLIFIFLVFYSLIYSENLYHKLNDPELKKILMATMLSFIGIYLILIINDMIESIKVGTIFYFNLAILVLIEKWNKKTTANSL